MSGNSFSDTPALYEITAEDVNTLIGLVNEENKIRYFHQYSIVINYLNQLKELVTQRDKAGETGASISSEITLKIKEKDKQTVNMLRNYLLKDHIQSEDHAEPENPATKDKPTEHKSIKDLIKAIQDKRRNREQAKEKLIKLREELIETERILIGNAKELINLMAKEKQKPISMSEGFVGEITAVCNAIIRSSESLLLELERNGHTLLNKENLDALSTHYTNLSKMKNITNYLSVSGSAHSFDQLNIGTPNADPLKGETKDVGLPKKGETMNITCSQQGKTKNIRLQEIPTYFIQRATKYNLLLHDEIKYLNQSRNGNEPEFDGSVYVNQLKQHTNTINDQTPIRFDDSYKETFKYGLKCILEKKMFKKYLSSLPMKFPLGDYADIFDKKSIKDLASDQSPKNIHAFMMDESVDKSLKDRVINLFNIAQKDVLSQNVELTKQNLSYLHLFVYRKTMTPEEFSKKYLKDNEYKKNRKKLTEIISNFAKIYDTLPNETKSDKKIKDFCLETLNKMVIKAKEKNMELNDDTKKIILRSKWKNTELPPVPPTETEQKPTAISKVLLSVKNIFGFTKPTIKDSVLPPIPPDTTSHNQSYDQHNRSFVFSKEKTPPTKNRHNRPLSFTSEKTIIKPDVTAPNERTDGFLNIYAHDKIDLEIIAAYILDDILYSGDTNAINDYLLLAEKAFEEHYPGFSYIIIDAIEQSMTQNPLLQFLDYQSILTKLQFKYHKNDGSTEKKEITPEEERLEHKILTFNIWSKYPSSFI